MKRLILICGFLAMLSTAAFAWEDLTRKIPEISRSGTGESIVWLNRINRDTVNLSFAGQKYHEFSDGAQYKDSDWSCVLGIMHHVTVEEALEYATQNPEVTYFFYTKGCQMVLETSHDEYRIFHYGDAVFFKGKHCITHAPGLADSYAKYE